MERACVRKRLITWAYDRTLVVQQWPPAPGEAKNPIAVQSRKA